MTEVSSHSSSACRRKMPSAAVRPAGVRWRSRPSAWATSPSATSRRNISLAAWVVTPRWRAIWAAVTRLGVVGADEDAQGEEVLLGSGRQVARIVASRHRVRIRDLLVTRRCAARRPMAMARPASQARSRTARAPLAANRRPRRRPWPTGRATRRPRRPAGPGRPSSRSIAATGISEQHREGEDLQDEEHRAGDAVVACRREPAAAGHLADQPAETEGDRQPADERPREPAARSTEAVVGQGVA